MSSNEEGEGTGLHHPLKKRSKVQRACNMCRRRKVRCDGSEMKDGMACSNCVTAGQECVYAVTSTKRGPYHGKAYVHKIETRLEKLERLFRHLHPEMDLDDLDGLLQQQELNAQSERSSAPLSRMSPSPGSVKEPADYSEFIEGVIRAAAEISISSIPDEDYSINPRLIEELAGIPKGDFHNESTRFFGKSSEPAFLQAAIDLKIGVTAQQNNNCVDARFLIRRREVFWEVPKWEALPSIDLPPPTYHFPSPDLMQSLIHLYFVHWNLYLPLLHRPTFEKAVRDGLHLRDVAFGGVVMLVCANGAKFSDDPRVLLDGTTSPLSRGWRWFLQVQFVKKSLAVAPSLYDIQFYCLAIHFLKGSSYTHASWLLVGIALRLALDRGIHRSKRTERVSKVDHELWKRAFWILISMDRMISTILGRPSAIGDEDFDLDYPLEVDDEYWDHPDPDQSWKQPPNKPSLITAFSYHLRLTHILGLASRALYSSNKTKTFLGILGYEQTIVAAFDSNLNKWIDSVPEHLRWDPNRVDDTFFDQSADLHAYFYWVQLVVHRPFIQGSSPLAFTSMTLCTNAARMCSHILDAQFRRHPFFPTQTGAIGAFASGIVLLLRLWSAKRSGLLANPQNDMAEVIKCMNVLKSLELKWSLAGRLWDILYELADIGALPLPRPEPTVAAKDSNYHFQTQPAVSTSPAIARSSSDRGYANGSAVSVADSSSSFSYAPQPSGLSIPSGREGDVFPQSLRGTSSKLPTDAARSFFEVPSQIYAGAARNIDSWTDALSDPSQHMVIDTEIIDMWLKAPSGFELEDWERYLSSADDLAQTSNHNGHYLNHSSSL